MARQGPGKTRKRAHFLTPDTSGIVSRPIPGYRTLSVLPQSFFKLPEDLDYLQLLDDLVILEINSLVFIQPPADNPAGGAQVAGSLAHPRANYYFNSPVKWAGVLCTAYACCRLCCC